MIQKRLCTLSAKVNRNFNGMIKICLIMINNVNIFIIYIFCQGFSLLTLDTDESQDSKGREGTIFYSTLPLPLAYEHSAFICNFACEMTTTYF